MRVDLEQTDSELRYSLTLDDEDRRQGSTFLPRRDRELRLVTTSFRVVTEAGWRAPHPDLHALALYLMLHPFLGRRLLLPFRVSQALAARMEAAFGLEVGPADASVAPREPPREPTPALLFSGGMDSTAASLILPRETLHLFQDRIPLPEYLSCDALVDFVQQRALCGLLAARGSRVLQHRDDHEAMIRPYPFPHTNKNLIPVLYRAEALGIGELEHGAVLADRYFEGYVFGEIDAWRFRPAGTERRARPTKDLAGGAGPAGGEPRPALSFDDALDCLHAAAGLSFISSTCGLSEVATALIVHRSPLRGRSFSCHQRALHTACLACDKCFRKSLLQSIFHGREVPAALVDVFLASPEIRQVFARPFFDFHHVWFYVLQNVRCRHPFIEALQRRAQAGPDVSFLAKWYAGDSVPERHRDTVVANIRSFLEVMSDEEQRRLERLELPPLGPMRPEGDAA